MDRGWWQGWMQRRYAAAVVRWSLAEQRTVMTVAITGREGWLLRWRRYRATQAVQWWRQQLSLAHSAGVEETADVVATIEALKRQRRECDREQRRE